ncbi:hypothetical protein COLINT_02932 [Collinsella intestinalis DSM 13280]|uniref:Uncharacterized protein n=1 Tax=Collinsella intestinalis DSM 13280 TaxID=521003 RepID=C4FA40_9ACTN|nr:hypothetical protein COLINT_02932 [Collinsella intestinalis DSM 13280]
MERRFQSVRFGEGFASISAACHVFVQHNRSSQFARFSSEVLEASKPSPKRTLYPDVA